MISLELSKFFIPDNGKKKQGLVKLNLVNSIEVMKFNLSQNYFFADFTTTLSQNLNKIHTGIIFI